MSIETSSFNKIKNQHIEHGGGGLVAKSCLNSHDPMEYSSLHSSVNGISQARILEWVAIAFSRGLSHPGTELACPALTGRFFTTEPQGKLYSIYYTQLIDLVLLNPCYTLSDVSINYREISV